MPVEDLSHGPARLLEVHLENGQTVTVDGDDTGFELRDHETCFEITTKQDADDLIGAMVAVRDSIWPDSLTQEQLIEAMQQIKSHCRMLMEQYRAGGKYQIVSVRGVLNELGYEVHADQIIQYMAERGFNYCIDPIIPLRGSDEYPSAGVCYWGADQLESRII